MHGARWFAAGLAALHFLAASGTVQAQTSDDKPAQPVPTPGQPTRPPSPTPAQPTRPETQTPARPEGPTPTTPTKEAEPEPVQPPPIAAEPPQRIPEEVLRSPVPTFLPPPVFVGPDLFNPPAPQGWLSLTPSFTLSGGYDDNIFLRSRNVRSDEIIGFTPGVTVAVQRPSYRLLAGYNVSGEVYLENSNLSNFARSQNLFADAIYDLSPSVRLMFSDQFVYSQDSNVLTSSGASIGRETAWRNTATPRLRWQATPNTALNLVASHTILQFDKSNDQDSNTYRIGAGAEHRLTQRLTGYLDMNVGYLDVRGDPSVWTYTPTLGLSYDVTKTLRASLSGGPTIVDTSGDTRVFPAISAGLTQTFKFGYVQAGYNRAVTAETLGASDTQTFFGSVVVSTLVRGLQLGFTPRYSIVDNDLSDRFRSSSDIKVFTLNLGATYQIARNISVIGSYTFFQQRSDVSNSDVDQNRVFLGLQYAFPINFY
jgi:opacity protein-like surface antigen